MKKPEIMKYEDFSVEEKKEEQKFDYGCAMLHFDFPKMKNIHENIEEGDVYTEEGDRSFGLETDPHVTLLYGFHADVDGDTVGSICANHTFDNMKLENLSCFENPKFDVLKFDVKGNGLHECNKKLSDLPHTTDYPDYHPHATIGYLKPGTAKKYIQKMKEESHDITPKSVVYSMPSGKKLKWDI
jgi:hypothetical protein